MKRTPLMMIQVIAALLAGPASGAGKFTLRDQLNDPSRGTWADDTADVLKPRQLLYEAKDDGRYRISYNLIRQSEGDVKGYFVRLLIRNLSPSATTTTVDVTLIDAENSVISATDRETFRALATNLTGAKVAAATLKESQASSANQDIFQAYQRGQAEGAVMKATADADTGRKMSVWADSFWLRPTFELPPNGQISGVRVFLAEPDHPLPLTVRVTVDDSQVEFITRAK